MSRGDCGGQASRAASLNVAPLTPALSLRERELVAAAPAAFLLPEGEGQGEHL